MKGVFADPHFFCSIRFDSFPDLFRWWSAPAETILLASASLLRLVLFRAYCQLHLLSAPSGTSTLVQSVRLQVYELLLLQNSLY